MEEREKIEMEFIKKMNRLVDYANKMTWRYEFMFTNAFIWSFILFAFGKIFNHFAFTIAVGVCLIIELFCFYGFKFRIPLLFENERMNIELERKTKMEELNR